MDGVGLPARGTRWRWAQFLSDEKLGKESPKEGPSPSLWNPPRLSMLSAVAAQSGPKGNCHARRERGSLLLCRCWDSTPCSRFRPYLWRIPADSGRARPPPTALEALVEGVKAGSGVEAVQRCARPSNPPLQAQGRLGPQPGTTNQNMGFPKGSPFGGSLVTFCPSESHPSGAFPPGAQVCV